MYILGKSLPTPLPSSIRPVQPTIQTHRRRCISIYARQSPADDPGSNFNPFKKKNSKEEEAARRTLEGLFKGQKDVLAAYDGGKEGGPGGRGGGGGGGGGSGGGGWKPPDWGQWADGFGKRMSGGLKAIGALLLFVGAFVLVPLIPTILSGTLNLLKWILRLEGRAGMRQMPVSTEAVQSTGSGNLGQQERSVIAKYGGDVDMLAGDDSEASEEEEDGPQAA